MIRAAFIALLLLSAPALADEHGHADEPGRDGDHRDDHDGHVAESVGIRAIHAWTNATGTTAALVFVEIENTSEDTVTLLGARTDIAASAQLVALENVGGQLRYAPIPQMPIATGSKVVLAPNGLAIELSDLSRGLEQGGHFEATLLFEDTELPVTVEIESASATRHSHAGHAH